MQHHRPTTLSPSSRPVRAMLIAGVLTGLATAAVPTTSHAQFNGSARPPASVQREFKQDIAQRDDLIREIYRLETQAIADTNNNQVDPQVALQQQNLHSRLRFVELKLDIVADQHRLDVPPRIDPTVEPVTTDHERTEAERLRSLEEITPDAMPGMRHRARVALIDMFKNLRFDGFPE